MSARPCQGPRRSALAALLIVAAGVASAAATLPPDRLRTLVPPSGTDGVDAEPCGTHPHAERLAALIRAHPLQQRVRLRCNGLLAAIAADKAAEMARRGQVTHHFGVRPPNRRLRLAGYRLPPSYPGTFHNQVEAVAGGYSTPELAMDALLTSTPHREHVLAEHPFYAEQDEIGVGYARNPNTNHIDYWVVYIARKAPASGDSSPAATSTDP